MTVSTTSHGEERAELAGWAQGLRRSALQEMLVAASRPDIISFALGLPAAELFPAAALAEAAARVLPANSGALQYSPPLQSLKRHVRELTPARIEEGFPRLARVLKSVIG